MIPKAIMPAIGRAEWPAGIAGHTHVRQLAYPEPRSERRVVPPVHRVLRWKHHDNGVDVIRHLSNELLHHRQRQSRADRATTVTLGDGRERIAVGRHILARRIGPPRPRFTDDNRAE